MPAHNPFIPQKPACDLEAFWGRQRELRLLSSYLLDSDQPQSCIVIGPALIGKTSLLCYLLTRHQAALAQRVSLPAAHIERLQQTVEILLPMSDLTTARPERFYQRLLLEMRRHLTALVAQGQPALAIPSRAAISDPTLLLERFRELLDDACAAGYRFHFLLDDFATVTKNPDAFDETFFIQLRSWTQFYNVAWIIASERRPQVLWGDTPLAHLPFFGSLRPIFLGLLLNDEADMLLEETIQRSGRAFTPEERSALLRLAGPHPAFLQLAGAHFYEARFSRRLTSRAALSDATHRYTSAAQPLYMMLWEKLDTAGRQALLASLPGSENQVLSDADPAANQDALLKTLAQQHALLRSGQAGDGYLPFGEGFATFLRDLQAEAQRTDEDDYQDLARLVTQSAAARDERDHINTALRLFREGKYEAGLRDLFPSLEQVAGALIQQRARRVPDQQFGPRLEQLRHLDLITQETFDLGLRLVRERINAAHGYAIADAQQVARSAVILGRRLLQESQRA